MEIDVQDITALDPGKFYHVELRADAGASEINSFASALKAAGLRAFITRGQIKITAFQEMFAALSDEEKQFILDSLQKTEINPLQHEQTK